MKNKISLTRRQAASAGLGLTAAAFCVPATAKAVPPDTSLPPSQTPAAPVPSDQIQAAISQLGPLAKDLIQKSGIPGMAVAAVYNGRTVYAEGFGIRRAGAPDMVNADTVFQLASVSKSISATILAQQIGLGGLSWNTPVVEHLPWFALNDPWVTAHATLADMFAHRSGLPDHAGDDLEDLGYSRDQILHRLRYLPLNAFRNTYGYTNFGLTAAAVAAAAAAGTDWASLAEAVLYRPLGMDSTSSRFADFIRRPNRATPHVKVGGAYAAKYQRQPDAQTPAGGVSASVRDMARWMAMVLQNGEFNGAQIVDAAALLPAVTAEMITAPSPAMSARPETYGYGFNVGTQPTGRTTLSHSGAFSSGAGTNFLMIPSLNLGVIALTNASPTGAAEALTAAFADLAQYGAVSRDWYAGYHQRIAPLNDPVGTLAGASPPANPAPPANLQAYTGTYQNDYFGPAEIEPYAAGLLLKLGPRGVFPLTHWDGNIFTYIPAGENAPDGSRAALTFARNPASFTIDIYAESRANKFVRLSASRESSLGAKRSNPSF
jgi:CubicO group peptidase (beta-lactamase class C family)